MSSADPASPPAILLAVRELGAGGSERQMVEMAKALHQRGRFTVHAACFRDGFRGAELRQAGVRVLDLAMQSLRGDGLRAARQFRQYLEREQVRLVHSFDYPTSCWLTPVARWARVPAVLTSQRAYRSLNPRFYIALERWSDRLAHGVVVNCEAMRRHLIDDEGVPAARVHLCYNGMDLEAFPFRPAREAGPLTIGSVCVHRPEKDLGTLVRAFAAMRDPSARLLLVGDGPERAALERLARESGAAGRIEFAGLASNVVPALHAMDIFVLPTLSEAFSNSIMEALACGCVVVATGTGGNPELIRPGETGLLFPPRDAPALTAALDNLALDPALRQRLSAAGAAWVRSRFSREQAAARLEEIYGAFGASR